MELATNQFNKGLQMDTNPMVLGNDTLTDCLNGTLITMNGNEVILLNDMGNRRVSNAFLPPGYEPVGMKEYGGIIYVAAYNPITNKSLIGSFPSPLRKIDSLEGDIEPLSINLDEIFFKEGSNVFLSSEFNNEILILNSDSFMYPLTNNILIHSGDKFVVYAPGLSLLKGLISNYDNIEKNSGKIYSPKNRKYTLQLGILNSLNEFVDITKTLERWNSEGEIILNNSKNSEEYKFNQGYFIPDGFTDKLQGETVDDANLLLERLKLSTNTYAYKLVGPLYLKVIYNHILSFSYNIDANISEVKTGNGGIKYKDLELTIEGFITYNCPDTNSSEDSMEANSEKYYTYDEVVPDNSFGFHLIGYEEQGEYGLQEQNYSSSVYDPITNTYSVKITKTYKIKRVNFGEVFKYTIGVFTGNSTDNNPIYLKECSSSGELNLSLLKSSRVFFKEWRFFNNVDEEKTTLLYNLNCYPKKNKQFENLKFHFEELVGNGETPESFDYPFNGDSLPVNNGRTIQVINWEDKIKKRKVYKITASYDIRDKNTEEVETVLLKESEMQYLWYNSPQLVERWFLSTELLNSLYSQSSGILDFCNPDYSGYYIILEKLTVPYKLNILVDNISLNIGSSKKLGNFFAFNNNYANYSYLKDSEYTVKITPSIELLDTELYPEFISLQNYSLSLHDVSKIKIVGKDTINNYPNTALCTVSGNIQDIIGFDDSLRANFKNKKLVDIYVSPYYGNNEITLLTTCMHYYCGQAQTINQLENPFIDFKKGLAQHLPKSGYFGGVYPNNTTSVSATMHNINYYYNLLSYLAGLLSSKLSPLKSTNIGETKNFSYQDVDDYINLLFNDHCFQSLSIQFIFPLGGTTHLCHLEIGTLYNNNYARVWWKGLYNGREYWYPLSNFLSKLDWEAYLRGEKDLGFFLKILGISSSGEDNYVYSSEKLSTNHPVGVAKPENSIYTTPYSFPISLDAEFRPVGNIDILQTLNYGCLIFHSYFGSIKQTVENIITVESDPNFIEDIDLYDFDDIKNIYYSEDKNTILDCDDRGTELDPNEQYRLNTDGKGNYELHKLSRKFVYLKELENMRVPLGIRSKMPDTETGDEDSYSTSQQNGITKLSYA